MPGKQPGTLEPGINAAASARVAHGRKPAGGGSSAKAACLDSALVLRTVGAGRSATPYKAKEIVFAQGRPADAVFYIVKGRVQLAVVSRHGKEAVVAVLGPGDFFGEGCLAGQTVHMASATAKTASSVLRIDRATMIRALREQPVFSELFMAFVLSHNIEVEADLVDQLFNSSERRLARLLLLLANRGKMDTNEPVVPKVTPAMLASRIGITRARVNAFMSRFRKLGFVDYTGGLGALTVNTSLLGVVVHD